MSLRLLLACLVLLIANPLFAQNNKDELRENFHRAPDILPGDSLPLKGLPMWHTNGPLNSDQIHEFFVKGKENGFGGITFLPLGKTTPKHLSPEYFHYFGEMLQTAQNNNMKVIFYDDVDFPSGSAGGTIYEQFPENTLKRLDRFEWDVTGPASFSQKCPIPLKAKARFGDKGGVLQAAVALNLDNFKRINLADSVHEGTVTWNVPEGKWKIFLFVCVADTRNLVDFMSPEAVRNFMTLTYDPFYKKFPEAFGTTIPMVFFDDITNTQTEGSRNWSLGFNAKYQEMFKRDPVLDYPALFYPIGKETASARWRLWTVRNELFADGYPKVVHEWCQKHHVLSSGHPQGPYVINSLDMNGDAFLSHRSSDAVLFDSIHYYGHGRDGFKIPTSAAFNFDHDICVVEIYGNYRPKSFDDSMMYRSAMEIFARGGNLLLPHGIWSDPQTMYIPPEISWRNPALKGCLPEYGKFVSRCCLLLRGGRHVADLGMIYPIDAIKAFFHFQWDFVKDDYPYGIYIPQETDYLAIGSDLTSRIYHDFTLLHPTILDSKCETVQKDGLTTLCLKNERNREEYRVIILTGADVITWSNMKKVLTFHRSGGKVLATTRLPSRSAEGNYDHEVREAVREMFGIDPCSQKPREAIRSGQEDITQPASFRKAREINRKGQYITPVTPDMVEYNDAIKKTNAIFLPRPTTDAIRTALAELLPNPDVLITPVAGKTLPTVTTPPRWECPIVGMVQYIHKIKNDRNLYYLANSSDESAEFDLRVRGHFEKMELWNPHDGTTSPISTDMVDNAKVVRTAIDKDSTTYRVKLPPVTSWFLVEGK